jgi:hypothetical protein
MGERVMQTETRLSQLRATVARSLGSESVDVILKRAIAEVARTYPGIRQLRYDEENIDFSAAEVALAEAGDDMNDALNALTAVMLLIMARLLGREIALRLAAGIDGEALLDGGTDD